MQRSHLVDDRSRDKATRVPLGEFRGAETHEVGSVNALARIYWLKLDLENPFCRSARRSRPVVDSYNLTNFYTHTLRRRLRPQHPHALPRVLERLPIFGPRPVEERALFQHARKVHSSIIVVA